MNLSHKALEGVGLIIPPPDIKGLLETTASFLASRHDRQKAVEARIRQKHADDPSFTFLHETDPYHAYFRHRIEQLKTDAAAKPPAPTAPAASADPSSASAGAAAPATTTTAALSQPQPFAAATTSPTTNLASQPANPDQQQQPQQPKDSPSSPQQQADQPLGKTTAAAAVISLIKANRAKAAAARPEPTQPPPNDVFSIPHVTPPPNAFLLDVIKLTAQFAARHGPSFLSVLAGKELRNSLFDFLRPIHPYYPLFLRLVDAYRLLLSTGPEKQALIERFRAFAGKSGTTHKSNGENTNTDDDHDDHDGRDDDALRAHIWYLHDWECQKAERELNAQLNESERIRNAQIDWHDFVVVATVDFDDDDETQLPAPVADAQQLPRMLAVANAERREREKNRGDVDMELDDEDATGGAANGTGPTAPRISGSKSTMVVDGQVQVHREHADADIPADRIRRDSNANGATAGAGAAHAAGATSAAAAGPALVAGAHATTGASMTATGAAARSEGGTISTGMVEATVRLPSGQRVPVSKVDKSMRSELVNPSYKAEQARAAEKRKVQNLAGGEEVARNLARLEQAQREAGVYNRGDLQEALSGKRGRVVSDAEVERRLGKATEAGPAAPHPGVGSKSAELGREAKRARVEAAVDALSRKADKGDDGGGGSGRGNAHGTGGGDDAGKDEERAAEDAGDGPGAGDAAAAVSGMVPAEEWVKRVGTTKAKIRVAVARHEKSEWQLNGQEIELSAPLKSSVGKLKAVLAKLTQLPPNKQKLHLDAVGFLKDGLSLAAYNVADGTVIALDVKERGRRRR